MLKGERRQDPLEEGAGPWDSKSFLNRARTGFSIC
jgi:hypothetical protein